MGDARTMSAGHVTWKAWAGLWRSRKRVSIDVYITDLAGQPAATELATLVRTKLEDKRKALHDMQVLPANLFAVTVAVRLVLRADAVLENIQEQITTQIKTYLKGRSQIVYQQIGALFFVDGVDDFTAFTLNGREANLTVPSDAVSSLSLVVTT